jgi:hypothetical protein
MRDVISVVADNISTTTTNTARIIVTPNAKRPGLYDACLDYGGVLIIASRQPFLDAARRLLDLGYDPTIVLVMEHGCLTAQIGAAAKLRVKEDRRGPRFVDWEPISSAKAKGLRELHATTPMRPARDPAQQALLFSRQITPPPNGGAATASAGVAVRP